MDAAAGRYAADWFDYDAVAAGYHRHRSLGQRRSAGTSSAQLDHGGQLTR